MWGEKEMRETAINNGDMLFTIFVTNVKHLIKKETFQGLESQHLKWACARFDQH